MTNLCNMFMRYNDDGIAVLCHRAAVLTVHLDNDTLHYCEMHAVDGTHRICMRAVQPNRYQFESYSIKHDPYQLEVRIKDRTPEVDA